MGATQGRAAAADALRGRDAVVHLLGETIAQRWTDEAKREIRDSRVLSTRNLVAALGELPEGERPRVLVSAVRERLVRRRAATSASTRPRRRATTSSPERSGDWEAEAAGAEELGVRVVLPAPASCCLRGGRRAREDAALLQARHRRPVAGGRQYVPWVHLDDVVGAILFGLDTDAARGPVNVTAPEPVTNKELSKALGRVLAARPSPRCPPWR